MMTSLNAKKETLRTLFDASDREGKKYLNRKEFMLLLKSVDSSLK